MDYRARLTREGRRWLVDFPDCPGCQTFGSSHASALAAAREALEGWLEAGLVSEQVPPRPRARKGELVSVPAALSVALQLRWWRDAHGLTRARAARRAGVSLKQLAQLEHPDGSPTLSTVERVASALGLRVDVTLGAA